MSRTPLPTDDQNRDQPNACKLPIAAHDYLDNTSAESPRQVVHQFMEDFEGHRLESYRQPAEFQLGGHVPAC